ncbi:hypothetical protein JW859_01245 [bacterium]|nr:hypothetical protein [bacterium]
MPVRVLLILVALLAMTVSASAQDPPTQNVVQKDVVVISESADPAAVLVGEDAAAYLVSENGAKIYTELLKAIEQLVDSGDLSQDGAKRLNQLLEDLKESTSTLLSLKGLNTATVNTNPNYDANYRSISGGQTPPRVESEIAVYIEGDADTGSYTIAPVGEDEAGSYTVVIGGDGESQTFTVYAGEDGEYQVVSGNSGESDPFTSMQVDGEVVVMNGDEDGPVTADSLEVTIDEDGNYKYVMVNPEGDGEDPAVAFTIVTEEDGVAKTITVTPDMQAEADFMTVTIGEDGEAKIIDLTGDPEIKATRLVVKIGEDGAVTVDGEGIDEDELREIRESIEQDLKDGEGLQSFLELDDLTELREFQNGNAHLFMIKPHLEALKELQGLSEEELEALDLPEKLLKLYELKELEGLKELENLDSLKFMYELPELEALEELRELPQLQELEGLDKLSELEELKELDGLHEEIERVLKEVESLLEELAELKELKEAEIVGV